MDKMTQEQKDFCVRTGQWMDRIKDLSDANAAKYTF